jgi:hypothetical protein
MVVFQVRERVMEELVNRKFLYTVPTQLEFWVKEDLAMWYYWPKRKHWTDLTNFLPSRW